MPLNPSSSLAKLFDAPARSGRLAWIGIRPERRAEMSELESVELDPEQGIVGDRYSRVGGTRQVTLVQAEHLAAIASHLGLAQIPPTGLRRNLVTEGINLLALKEKWFRIGSALLETTGECHPCSRMEENLGVGGYNAVRGLGGITARVIDGGRIRINDSVERLDRRPFE